MNMRPLRFVWFRGSLQPGQARSTKSHEVRPTKGFLNPSSVSALRAVRTRASALPARRSDDGRQVLGGFVDRFQASTRAIHKIARSTTKGIFVFSI